jgi:hypothetical protein
MKRFSFLLLLLFLTVSLVSYSSAEDSYQFRYPGRSGIILAWNGSWDIGVGTFEGGIGYKHWTSNRVALKSFLNFGKTDETIVNEDDGYPPEYRLRESSFSLLTGAEDHFWNRGRLSFFFGGGILFKMSSSKTNYIIDDPVPDEIKEVKSHKNTWGAQSTMGVEYLFTKNLSLSGQYQIDFSLEKESLKFIYWGISTESQSRKQKTTTWNLDISTSLLMLTIYLR